MGWRVVVISHTAKLDCSMGYLCVRNGMDLKRIFLDEISVLMIESEAVSLTSYLLVELANKKIDVIFCDEKKNPNGQYIPYYGAHDTSKKLKSQISWSSQKGEVWRKIVSRKILGQSEVLKINGHFDSSIKLIEYISQIEYADATNREGHAAKVYFNTLFGKSFSRENKEQPINAALNYGYSILLSAVAREIISCGYITQIGIFHDNMFNQYNLACDLMEPFRPFIDEMVYKLNPNPFKRDDKLKLINVLNYRVKIEDKEQTMLNAIQIYVKSVLDVLDNSNSNIKFPDYEFSLYESNSSV